jgi:hypothetical protein
MVSLNLLPRKVMNMGHIRCHHGTIFDKCDYTSQSVDRRPSCNLRVHYQASNQRPLDLSYNDYNNLDSDVHKIDSLHTVLGI